MKLFHSHSSPFVRKVMIVAHEVGLADRIECLPAAAHPTSRDGAILAHHPLAQVPTLIDDEGRVIADSRVICEYLNALGGGGLFPETGPRRWIALSEQSIADGLLDAALLIRYEVTVRPESERSPAWIAGQSAKIDSCLDAFEDNAEGFADRMDIGTISIACALGYLDLRFADRGWRENRPATHAWFDRIRERPAMLATQPPTA